jgi:hypothetical protein
VVQKIDHQGCPLSIASSPRLHRSPASWRWRARSDRTSKAVWARASELQIAVLRRWGARKALRQYDRAEHCRAPAFIPPSCAFRSARLRPRLADPTSFHAKALAERLETRSKPSVICSGTSMMGAEGWDHSRGRAGESERMKIILFSTAEECGI